jgi:hypothetical protein
LVYTKIKLAQPYEKKMSFFRKEKKERKGKKGPERGKKLDKVNSQENACLRNFKSNLSK